MDPVSLALLCLAITAVAFLYSSVGHAGASGYIAVMTLLGVSALTIKPIALTLNIGVACIGTVQFFRAGYFSWKTFWPFALLSIPASLLGGYLHLSAHLIGLLIGIVLLCSAIGLLFRYRDPVALRTPTRWLALSIGAGLGFLAGITGTGGGIFLTPLLIFSRWTSTKTAAAVSALFILCNSTAGLIGFFLSGKTYPHFSGFLLAAALIGGALGSYYGSRRFSVRKISLCLALVLCMAGIKLIILV